MRIVWSELAIGDLVSVAAYIAQNNPVAADGVVGRIESAVQLLAQTPLIGKAGRVSLTRELAVVKTPYIVVYRVMTQEIRIIRVYHSARRWPDKFDA